MLLLLLVLVVLVVVLVVVVLLLLLLWCRSRQCGGCITRTARPGRARKLLIYGC